MTNGEFRRVQERLIGEVDRRMDRLEKKIDAAADKCVGCSRQFGSFDADMKGVRDTMKERTATLATDLKDIRDTMKEHVAEHRWRIGVAAAMGGVIVAVANFLLGLVRQK